jgi:hypothetical protein
MLQDFESLFGCGYANGFHSTLLCHRGAGFANSQFVVYDEDVHGDGFPAHRRLISHRVTLCVPQPQIPRSLSSNSGHIFLLFINQYISYITTKMARPKLEIGLLILKHIFLVIYR